MTKHEQILNWLLKHGSITSWEAIKRFNATRLADDVMRLNRQGKIKTRATLIKRNNTHYARYEVIR